MHAANERNTYHDASFDLEGVIIVVVVVVVVIIKNRKSKASEAPTTYCTYLLTH